jgi:RING finger/CHY zinc finger protein 1
VVVCRSNYFHCEKCVACLPLSMKGEHKCISESLRVNCPVCLEFLMDSVHSASILKCGHAIHSSCQEALLKSGNPRCPICNASFLDMKRHWKYLDQLVSAVAMPRELRDWQVQVLCADCHETCMTTFHFEGLKCTNCGEDIFILSGIGIGPK